MDVGGVPDHVMTLARSLGPRHDLTVFSGEIDPRHEAELLALGVRIERLPFARLPDPLRDLRVLLSLRRLLGKGRFDVVHTHMSKAALLGVMATRLMPGRPRVVNTAHNLGSLALRKPLARLAFRFYDRMLLGRATDRVIVVSERIREQVLALGLIAPARVTAIANGISLERFDVPCANSQALRADLGLAQSDVLVLCVARLVWFKGLDLLISAFARVAAAAPGARLCIVGAGPLRDALQAQAASLGLGKQVSLIGERQDVPALLAACDLFVLSSVSEGMPISILEAMAAGRATVATDVGGVRELVRDGETGLLVASGDAAGLGAALLMMIRDPGERGRMGAVARALAYSGFGGAAMSARTEALYLDVLARRADRP